MVRSSLGTSIHSTHPMGYHHDLDGRSDSWEACESQLREEPLRRAERRDLQPHEGMRLVWEGAVVVRVASRDQSPPLTQAGVALEMDQSEGRVHQFLPDRNMPLVCVAQADEDAIALAETLLDLGYGHVFTIIQADNAGSPPHA